MTRVTSLTNMPEAQLNRWIKRIALLFVVVLIAFIAFYTIDRWRTPAPAIADQKTAALEEAVRTDPADFSARGQLADIYLAAGRYQDAIAQYSEIITAKHDLEAAYASRGRAYELTNDLDAAKSDYAQVVDIAKDAEMANVDPTLEMAYYGLGAIALKQEQPQEAVDQLQKALKISRTDADAMNLLGAAYIALGQPKDAIEPLRKAIEFVPVGWADPYATLAQAYTATGDTDEATWATALATLANGDPVTAQASLETIKDGSAKVDVLVGMALVAEANRNPAAAAAYYEQALALDSTNQMAQFGLSRTGAPASAAPASPAASAGTEGSN